MYVSDGTAHILIDMGLPLKEMKHRLSQIDITMDQVSAILITHEHMDHVRGLKDILKHYDIPVYVNPLTAKALKKITKTGRNLHLFETNESFDLGAVHIKPFRVMHDGVEPVGYTLQMDRYKIGIALDLGCITENVINALEASHMLILESNHDTALLHNSRRPKYLKQRIQGHYGHLSNADCAKLIETLLHKDLQYVFLAHLSQECNHPKLAIDTSHEVFLKNGYHDVSLNLTFQERISRTVRFEV